MSDQKITFFIYTTCYPFNHSWGLNFRKCYVYGPQQYQTELLTKFQTHILVVVARQ